MPPTTREALSDEHHDSRHGLRGRQETCVLGNRNGDGLRLRPTTVGADVEEWAVSTTEGCPCGNRTHEYPRPQCRVIEAAHQRVLGIADRYGVDPVAAVDLWAHARKALNANDASWVISDVLDLGWRPCVTFHARTEPTATDDESEPA